MGIVHNRGLTEIVVYGGFFILLVLFGLGRLLYFSIFKPKGKSFKDEVKENAGTPMSSGSESIGSISMRLGEDVRDVWMMGYSDDQINGVLTGEYTLEEMYKMKPKGNTKSDKGKEILAEKDQS